MAAPPAQSRSRSEAIVLIGLTLPWSEGAPFLSLLRCLSNVGAFITLFRRHFQPSLPKLAKALNTQSMCKDLMQHNVVQTILWCQFEWCWCGIQLWDSLWFLEAVALHTTHTSWADFSHALLCAQHPSYKSSWILFVCLRVPSRVFAWCSYVFDLNSRFVREM